MHRCFEKMAETHTWNQVIPFCDRLNYVSAMINGVGYVKTVEKMLGIEVPERGVLVRTILSEFSLDVIPRYFGDYHAELRRRLSLSG